MTLKEALDTGLKIRLPVGYEGIFSWPDYHHWVKVDNNTIKFFNGPDEGYTEKSISELRKIQLYSNDWYILEQDQFTHKLNKVLE